jgi:hypothetical protein
MEDTPRVSAAMHLTPPRLSDGDMTSRRRWQRRFTLQQVPAHTGRRGCALHSVSG